jgi:pyruvate dehydrogenase E1 component beta subunit
MAVMNMVAAINDALRQEMERDERMLIYGQDVGVNGGVFRVTAGLQQRFGVKRVFDTALAESGIVGTAFGMAAAGLHPVVEIQFSGFAWPAFNQIIGHLSRVRNRTRGGFTAPIVIRMPYGGGIRAVEHHSESMEAVWGHVPGLKVVIPSTPHDAKGLLIGSIRDPDPVIFMEPKRIYRSPKQEVPGDEYAIELGKARILSPGKDITLVSYGAQMKEAMAAAAVLRSENVSVELIDLRTIYPFDLDTILSSLRRTGRFLVVHEGPQSFGVGAELISSVVEGAFLHLEAPPARLTGADTVVPLTRGEKQYAVQADHIVKAVRKLVRY